MGPVELAGVSTGPLPARQGQAVTIDSAVDPGPRGAFPPMLDFLRSGIKVAFRPWAWRGWPGLVAGILVVCAVGDVVTTVLMLGGPGAYSESNPWAATGMGMVGVIGYCVVASVVMLGIELTIILGKGSGLSVLTIKTVTFLLVLAKAVVVCNNLAVWGGLVHANVAALLGWL